MGIKLRIFFVCLLLCILLMSVGCDSFSDFNTSGANLYGIKFCQVKADSSSAYYLSKDGTLYCTGADSDASSCVYYLDKHKGIVAHNVLTFGTMLGGGFYIDNNNDLYIWNRATKLNFNYTENRKSSKILENVKFAKFEAERFIYTDMDDDLYLVGDMLEEIHTVNNPKLVATDVVDADIMDGTVLWATKDGEINFLASSQSNRYSELEEFKKQTTDYTEIKQINILPNYIAFVNNNDLWYYGDYKLLTQGETDNKSESPKQLKNLCNNVSVVSCARETVMAMDLNGDVYLWGKCLSNDEKNVSSPEYAYYEKYFLTSNAKNIYVDGGTICYVDSNECSQIFSSGNWKDFYGNSTDDRYVGIKRSPKTWVQE